MDEEERKRIARSLTMTAAAAATRTVEIFEKGADSYCEGVTRISHGSGKSRKGLASTQISPATGLKMTVNLP